MYHGTEVFLISPKKCQIFYGMLNFIDRNMNAFYLHSAWMLMHSSGIRQLLYLWTLTLSVDALVGFHINPNIHVLSVLRPDEDSTCASHLRLWRWKEAVLGNGQDVFTSKRNTMRKLSTCVVDSNSHVIEEAVVLGNCKRLEIFVSTGNEIPSQELALIVASMLDRQVSILFHLHFFILSSPHYMMQSDTRKRTRTHKHLRTFLVLV